MAAPALPGTREDTIKTRAIKVVAINCRTGSPAENGFDRHRCREVPNGK
jgi:hypothetical protein